MDTSSKGKRLPDRGGGGESLRVTPATPTQLLLLRGCQAMLDGGACHHVAQTQLCP